MKKKMKAEPLIIPLDFKQMAMVALETKPEAQKKRKSQSPPKKAG